MSETDNIKVWHPLFYDYMNNIVNHENYEGLPYSIKKDGSIQWLATKQSDIGKKRIKWAHAKANELGITPEPGVFAKVMLQVHPTKLKVCQTCGKTMSLYYVYPNVNFVNKLSKIFGYDTDETVIINDIIDDLLNDHSEQKIKFFLIKEFSLLPQLNEKSIEEIIPFVEETCRLGNKKHLGPGAMSNFPDRFDGFHSYNRCCRKTQDKGRSKQNLKSYTKDRRAYEYWSDGNIHAANQYMGSSYFDNASADHVGPISLGFIHDSLVLRKMPSGDNSSKRDRLLFQDIVELIQIEKNNNISVISWYSQIIWNYIKENYMLNKDKIENYRLSLKSHMTNFMYILWIVINDLGEKGKKFLIKEFLQPKSKYFKYDYEFGELGVILLKKERNITDATLKEENRFYRIAIEGVLDYDAKENRNTKPNLISIEQVAIQNIVNHIKNETLSFEEIKKQFVSLIENMQKRTIKEL